VKSVFLLFLICVFGASLALPQAASTPAAKTPTTTATPKAAPKAVPKVAPKAAAPKTAPNGTTTTAKKSTTATKKTYKSTKKGPAPPAQTWRNRQLAPTAARYKEIQQALSEKGYLKTEPNGVWDAQSEEAMKQFQTERKLQPTGKINSPSLIGLGLGPKPGDAMPAAPDAGPTSTTEPPAAQKP
jgi:hypothetical protein